ncbi:dihydrodipicolinate synthase family protein [Arthrobacter globiformis]|uniref:dihydrodipicolinate synthase family protein n=1 Tax=Arthrobacter globiformis TaxID=1665 RepID=UPI000B41C8C8|nr:dihydrodipicolinate synthase family protein [Arthrobacter globiformis]
MTRSAQQSISGVIPAHLQPFTADGRLDEANLRRHLRGLLDVPGISGITTNAHASETATLTLDERARQLDIVLEETDGRVPVIAGIYEDGTAKAAAAARRAQDAGADALLVFPSAVLDGGGYQRPEMVLQHYSEIASASDLPLIAFIYPNTSALRMTVDGIVRLCTEIEAVVAIKEWSNDIVIYERTWRALKSLDRDISVLSSFSRSLFSSLCVGADGILSGHGSIVASLHVRLWEAVKKLDLAEAREVWNRIWPLAEECYKEPFLDGHNRMKTILALTDGIDEAHVRSPLQPLSGEEQAALRAAIEDSGLVRA